MSIAVVGFAPEPPPARPRAEPRWITLADLGVVVVGVALVMVVPSQGPGLPFFILGPPPIVFLVAMGGLRLTAAFGFVLALVVLLRRVRYGGLVRPAEWLALGLASLWFLDAAPNLDEVVNAWFIGPGSQALHFSVARRLLAAPAAAIVVLVAAGLVFLGRRARDGSRVASGLSVVGIVGGFFLCFWGPCEVARLELPWLLIPSPEGSPSLWGWRASVVYALHDLVEIGPIALIWGVMAAAVARAWRARPWVWTERAAVGASVVAALGLCLQFACRGI